ncbi:MAG: acyl-CoA thioesterase domain-containing protein [Rhodobacterales bacterium]
MQQEFLTEKGLYAALGGSVVHDDELGIHHDFRDPENQRMLLPFQPALSDVEGKAIGLGALVTLLDTVCGLTALRHLKFRESTATLDLRIDYLNATESGLDVIAEAHALQIFGAATRGSVVVKAAASHPGSKVPIAYAMGRFFRKTLPRNITAHDYTSDRSAADFRNYRDLMGFLDEEPGRITMPFRSGIIGNGALPSIHGGAIAAHLQQAAIDIMKSSCTPNLATAHFSFQNYGSTRDIKAAAWVEKQGRVVSYVAATSRQDGIEGNVASAVFTFLAS